MSLKVFDLQCDRGHIFEGWFAAADDYDVQRKRNILVCPICNSHEVNKMLSAPRLNMGRGTPDQASEAASALDTPASGSGDHQLAEIQAQMLRHVRQVIRNCEDVGDNFAQQARQMYEGEIEHRAIRGSTTHQEREELARDGIAVMPIPDYLDDDRLQ